MCGVTVLENEHAIVTFEIVKNDDDVSIVAINGKGFEVFKHVSGAVDTVEECRVCLFNITRQKKPRYMRCKFIPRRKPYLDFISTAVVGSGQPTEDMIHELEHLFQRSLFLEG